MPWVLMFDGLTEPRNPGGRMCWGWVINGTIVGKGTLPPCQANTNNRAEYMALGFGLLEVRKLRQAGGQCDRLICRGDSKLVIHQMAGSWRCNVEYLGKLRDRCLSLLKEIGLPYSMQWIPRAENEQADRLSREAYFAAEGKMPPSRH